MRRRRLLSTAALAVAWLTINVVAASEPAERTPPAMVVIVQGAAGTEEYERLFDQWASQWQVAARAGEAELTVVDGSTDTGQRDELLQAFANAAVGSKRPLWIVLIGHGTFDGRTGKFNLVGPDVSARELAEWLDPIKRPIAVIHTGSSSSPFIDRMSHPGRVIVTATRSGSEVNFTRFGGYLAAAIGDVTSDLDKDGQVSLLEAFLTASRQTEAYYDSKGQLATEHALLEDTGDARGVDSGFFEGIRPVKAAAEGETLDGHVAHQWHLVPSDEERRFPDDLRSRRDELELEIARLRDRKSEMDEESYYASLEILLVELAQLYEQADEAVDRNSDVGHETDAAPVDDLPPGEQDVGEVEHRKDDPSP
ncbi:MAG: hypothetical protein KDA93_11430 [Planctomycetaceae bacterium]|nr:hypothetical protein [Planctomycetaceae bacterium]